MILNKERVTQRAEARQRAKDAAGLLIEEAGRLSPEGQAAFWEEVRKLLPITRPAPPASRPASPGDEPFNDHQAKAFGRSKMPWGKYAGQAVDDVPLEYLEKLCEPQPFIRSLKRYTRKVGHVGISMWLDSRHYIDGLRAMRQAVVDVFGDCNS